jgi:hypothetical protein
MNIPKSKSTHEVVATLTALILDEVKSLQPDDRKRVLSLLSHEMSLICSGARKVEAMAPLRKFL